jgi:DNA modification methylase
MSKPMPPSRRRRIGALSTPEPDPAFVAIEPPDAPIATLAVEYRPYETLVPYDRNARTHSAEQVEQIAASMVAFGWTNPVLVDEHSGIIAGHGRRLGAQRAWDTGRVIPNVPKGMVPVIVLRGLSQAKKEALILADNKIALNAGWDDRLLATELANLQDALEAEGLDLAITGFDDAEASKLIDALEEHGPGLGGGDDAPDFPIEPVSRTGDLWLLGDHRLLVGDTLDPAAMERLMNGAKADLVLTDPPYGIDYHYSRAEDKGRIQGDKMSGADLINFLGDAFKALLAASKPSAPLYIWFSSNMTKETHIALGNAGKKPSTEIIWDKAALGVGFNDYRNSHEACIFVSGGKGAWYGGRDESTIWQVKRERDYKHPTQKPAELFIRAVRNSSKQGDMVVDGFGGSGTTVIACQATGRAARVMEKEPGYADVIIGRWQKWTGQAATLATKDGMTFAEVLAERQPQAPLGVQIERKTR